eukprot:CAMPEP_0203857890 /NCGR_PEP_ID=MMETSP0359-20131031/10978_1 /ASSEMBLY_ACC=CAM_ASM_000338 /TAXON_ID=268821 /ORGANISM="Scrippsiella Hangoei, Strain SHTV-5" /LENGTH=224 /DNA_ID=CAMNT_0050774625 /DNA_START=45 /DNA_END=719 /DNA_ORIENTATION=+
MTRAMLLPAAVAAALLVASVPVCSFVGPAPGAPQAPPRGAALRALGGDAGTSAEDGAFDLRRVGSTAAAWCLALIVALVPVAGAQAAKTGGRIGGSAQAARKAPPPPARTSSNVTNKTTIINKTTTVYAPAPAPHVIIAPSPVYGYVAPAPTLGEVIVGVAVGSALSNSLHSNNNNNNNGTSNSDRILENQQRQDERQMDKQANELADLQRELAQLKAAPAVTK